MIEISTTKIYVIYTRTNRRVQWRYAEYGGRYASADEALAAAERHYGIVPFEYQIENMETGEILKTGFVNWNNR